MIKTLGGDLESVCKELPARSRPSCRHHFLGCYPERRQLHRCYPWTSNEDRVLTALSHDEGTPLSEFSSYLPSRTSEACKSRYQKTLDIGKGPIHDTRNYWTALEDQKLIELQKVNKSWPEISIALGGAHSYTEYRAH